MKKQNHSVFARIYGTDDLIHVGTKNSSEAIQPVRLVASGCRALINIMTVVYDDNETLEDAKEYYIEQMIQNEWNNVIKQPCNGLVYFISEV